MDVYGGTDTAESPAPMTMRDGDATATVRFSSPNYESLVMTGETFEPIEVTADSATYEIPVRVFDTSIPVEFTSVASGAPEELEGSLSFHSGQVTNLAGETVKATNDAATSAEDKSETTTTSDADASSDVAESAQSQASPVPVSAIVVLVAAECALAAFLAFRKKARKESGEGGK